MSGPRIVPYKQRLLSADDLARFLLQVKEQRSPIRVLYCGISCYRDIQDLIKHAVYGDPLTATPNPRTDIERFKMHGVDWQIYCNVAAPVHELRFMSAEAFHEIHEKGG